MKSFLKLDFFSEFNLITVMPVCIKVNFAAMKPHSQNWKQYLVNNVPPLYQI